jgi:hypothetical protein
MMEGKSFFFWITVTEVSALLFRQEFENIHDQGGEDLHRYEGQDV